MKKTLINLFILIYMITSVSFGQASGLAENKSEPTYTKLNSSTESVEMTSPTKRVQMNDINIKALRDFINSYKTPADVRWSILADGFRVQFFDNGIQTRIFYDKHGNRGAMIRYYHEDQLPPAIRHAVRSNYYDFSIFNVTEVSEGDKTVYLVKIEDTTSWKTISITDGEMLVTEEYLKS